MIPCFYDIKRNIFLIYRPNIPVIAIYVFWLLEERCNLLSDRLAQLQTSIKERKQRADVIGGFMFEIKERDGIIDEFAEDLWTTLLESVTITREGKWLFKFKNERVVEV